MLIGADITYDPVLASLPDAFFLLSIKSLHIFFWQIKDLCSAMLIMMTAVGRSIDVFITATVRTQVLSLARPVLLTV